MANNYQTYKLDGLNIPISPDATMKFSISDNATTFSELIEFDLVDPLDSVPGSQMFATGQRVYVYMKTINSTAQESKLVLDATVGDFNSAVDNSFKISHRKDDTETHHILTSSSLYREDAGVYTNEHEEDFDLDGLTAVVIDRVVVVPAHPTLVPLLTPSRVALRTVVVALNSTSYSTQKLIQMLDVDDVNVNTLGDATDLKTYDAFVETEAGFATITATADANQLIAYSQAVANAVKYKRERLTLPAILNVKEGGKEYHFNLVE